MSVKPLLIVNRLIVRLKVYFVLSNPFLVLITINRQRYARAREKLVKYVSLYVMLAVFLVDNCTFLL